MHPIRFNIFSSASILVFLFFLTTQISLNLQLHIANLILTFFLAGIIAVTIIKMLLSKTDYLLSYKFFFGLLLVNALPSFLLYWIRLKENYQYVTWNVDWRQTLAQSYAYSVSASHNNLYDGFDSSYHSLAALLGSAMPSVFGRSPDILLFLFIPLLCVFSLINFLYVFIQKTKQSLLNFVLASNIVLLTPLYRFDNFIGFIRDYPDSFLFDARMMLNSYLAFALVLSAAALRIATNSFGLHSLIYGTTFVSLIFIKPQFIPFVVIFLLITRSFAGNDNSLISQVGNRFSWAREMVFLTLSGLLAMFFSRERTTLPIPEPSFSRDLSIFYQNRILLSFFAYFTLIGIVILLLYKIGLHLLAKGMFLISTIYVALFVAMSLLNFRITYDQAMRWNLLGPGIVSVFDSDLEQGFVIVFVLLIILFSVSITCLSYKPSHSPVQINFLSIFVVLVTLIKFGGSFQLYTNPQFGYEYLNNSKLVYTLEDTKNLTLILVNDFSDPADDYQRYGRGEYLASEGLYNYFIASKAPDSFMAYDFPSRLMQVKRFFNTPLSDYHEKFLEENQISHVLISERCLPVWFRPQSQFAKKDYVLIARREFTNKSSSFLDFSVNSSRKSQSKVSGLAKCL